MPLSLDHANLVVRDLAAQTAFYCDVLGFRPVLQRRLEGAWISTVVGAPGAVMDCVILDPPGGGARLELLAYRTGDGAAPPALSAPDTLGLRHLAFRVDDLDELATRLGAAGVALFSAPVAVPFAVGGRRKRLVYFLDPEGVLLELAEYRDSEES